MAGYRDHLLAGAVITGIAIYLLSPYVAMDGGTAVATAVFVFIGSILPDIDHRSAMVHRKVKTLLAFITGSWAWYVASGTAVDRIVPGSVAAAATILFLEAVKPKHRGITHTYRAAIFYGVMVGSVTLYVIGSFAPALFAFVAYTSHLVVDGTITF